jgi:hypothetical protein
MRAKEKRRPLPLPLPLDIAGILGVDRSFIRHINTGRKPIPLLMAVKIMELRGLDGRLSSIKFLDLKPELRVAVPYLQEG